MGGHSDWTEEKGLAFLELSAKDRTVQHFSNFFSFLCVVWSLMFAPIDARVGWGGFLALPARYRSLVVFLLFCCSPVTVER